VARGACVLYAGHNGSVARAREVVACMHEDTVRRTDAVQTVRTYVRRLYVDSGTSSTYGTKPTYVGGVPVDFSKL
jgi:hypothetical protein